MSHPRVSCFLFRLLCMVLPGLLLPAYSQTQPLQIGTGSVTGVYYPAGGAICRLLNKYQPTRLVHCTVDASGGSLDNLQGLREGKYQVGIVQSDIQQAALTGEGGFAEIGPDSHLRSLFSLYVEPLTLVTRTDTEIQSLEDLPGKRIDMGNPGSGDRNTMHVLMDALQWNESQFADIGALNGAERAAALCNKRYDAFAYVVGHPSGTVNEASNSCNIRLIPVNGKAIDHLLKTHPAYTAVEIPARLYRGVDTATPTFGVVATVVTTDQMPDEVAYTLVQVIFTNLEQFRRLHPAFAQLTPEMMVSRGLTAPLHPGAQRYYQDSGLLKQVPNSILLPTH